MAEIGSGKSQEELLKITGTMDPIRSWTEMGELRSAQIEEKKAKKGAKKVTVDERRGELRAFIKDENVTLVHILNAVIFRYQLMKNSAYDIIVVKSELQEMFNKNERIKKRQRGKLDKEQQKLQHKIVATRNKINTMLRKDSDLLGALTLR